jgi:hypothetical protein
LEAHNASRGKSATIVCSVHQASVIHILQAGPMRFEDLCSRLEAPIAVWRYISGLVAPLVERKLVARQGEPDGVWRPVDVLSLPAWTLPRRLTIARAGDVTVDFAAVEAAAAAAERAKSAIAAAVAPAPAPAPALAPAPVAPSRAPQTAVAVAATPGRIGRARQAWEDGLMGILDTLFLSGVTYDVPMMDRVLYDPRHGAAYRSVTQQQGVLLPPCEHGAQCRLMQDPRHCDQKSHPCRYGLQCKSLAAPVWGRRVEQHMRRYSH